MELVRGTTLKLIRERYRDAAFATFVTHQIAEGLHAIHTQGIIHREPFVTSSKSPQPFQSAIFLSQSAGNEAPYRVACYLAR